MTDYTNNFNGAAKDAANDTILGSEFDTEFDSLATVTGTKCDKVAGATNNNLMSMTAAGNASNSSIGTNGSGGITSGSWLATAIGPTKGGTGLTTYAQGELLYASAADTLSALGVGTDGQFLKTQGAAADPVWASVGRVFESAVATTSGTTVNLLTGTSGRTEIQIAFDAVSVSNNDELLIQLGHSNGPTVWLSSGYTSGARNDISSSQFATNGFLISITTSNADQYYGQVRLTHMGSNVWVYSSLLIDGNTSFETGGGRIDMGANELTAVRLTTTGGTNTFDNGQVLVSHQ